MDPKQEKWIDKLTHAANKRKEEKVKWDARDRALTQIRSKIAGKIGDNLIKDMNVTVSDGEKNKETTLDYENRDQKKEFDWAQQFDGYNSMSDEDQEKHARARILIETLQSELESATIAIENPPGSKNFERVKLFDKEDIAKEFYTPLVREGLMAETFVPNKYSSTHKMIEETFDLYKDKLQEEGYSNMAYAGECLKMGLSVLGSATSLMSTGPAFMDIVETSKDPDLIKWSNFVPETFVPGSEGSNGISEINDKISEIGEKGTSDLKEFTELLRQGMDVLNEVVVEGGIDVYEWRKKYKDPKTPIEPLDKRRLMAGRIANSLVSGVSGVVSQRMNWNKWNMGVLAGSLYRSNASLKEITELLQDEKKISLVEADGVEIVKCLNAGFAKIFSVFPDTVSKAQDAVTEIKNTFARCCSGSEIADLINEEKYPAAIKLVTTAATNAMGTATGNGELCQEITDNQKEITDLLGGEMAKELTDHFKETEKILIDDRKKIDAAHGKDKVSLIEKQIAKIERDNFRRKWFVTLMSQGTEFASKFFAPLVMAGAGVSLLSNANEAMKRATDAQNFLEKQNGMLRDASSFSASIQNFLINANSQYYHYQIQSCCDACRLIGALIETCGYATGPGSVIAAVVGQTMQASGRALSALEAIKYELEKNNEARAGWKIYKEALQKPENRKLALLAMKQNPTLAKYAVAWGAIIEKEPLLEDFLTVTGLTAESLADQKDTKLVMKYLETRFSGDNIIAGMEAVAKGWAPHPVELTLECWNAFIRRGKEEVGLVVDGKMAPLIENVEYGILACVKPWKDYEKTPSNEEVVKANLSALETLINELLKYNPKPSEGSVSTGFVQVREFLDSMKKLARKRVKYIKEPQSVAWTDLPADIKYGIPLGKLQKTAVLELGDGELSYNFKDGDFRDVGIHQLEVYARKTVNYAESRKVFANITVTKAEQVVEWVENLEEITTATKLGPAQKNAGQVPAADNGGGELKYSFNDGDTLAAGDQELWVHAEATENYNQSPTVTRKITVVAAAP